MSPFIQDPEPLLAQPLFTCDPALKSAKIEWCDGLQTHLVEFEVMIIAAVQSAPPLR